MAVSLKVKNKGTSYDLYPDFEDIQTARNIQKQFRIYSNFKKKTMKSVKLSTMYACA